LISEYDGRKGAWYSTSGGDVIAGSGGDEKEGSKIAVLPRNDDVVFNGAAPGFRYAAE
jgi:hypothetical protein